MGAPVFTASDFAQAIMNLLPRGRAWPRDPDSTFATIVSAAVGPTYARLQEADNDLISEALPSETDQLLPEWEESLGLPDPCAGEAPTTDGRRAQVLARFANSGGQSIPFFIQYALNLGIVITITYDAIPYRFGMPFGGAFSGEAAAFEWTVNLAGPGPNEVLECEFQRLKPAQTTIRFNYI